MTAACSTWSRHATSNSVTETRTAFWPIHRGQDCKISRFRLFFRSVCEKTVCTQMLLIEFGIKGNEVCGEKNVTAFIAAVHWSMI